MTAPENPPFSPPNPLPHHGDLVPQYRQLTGEPGSWPAGVPTLSPEELATAMMNRPGRRSGVRMSDGPDARAKINQFQRANYRTRPLEAISPGGAPEAPDYVRSLSFTHRTDTVKTIYNRDEGKTEQVYQHKWAQGQFAIVPQCVMYTTSLTGMQKTLLMILYDKATGGANIWYFHKHGRLRVEGVTLEFLAHHTGKTMGYVSKLLHDAAEKGFLQIHQRGNQKSNIYYLAKQENATWTYPAGSKESGRARMQRHMGRGLDEINWEAVRTQRFPRRRKNGSYRDQAKERESDAKKRAQAALRRAQQKAKSPGGDGSAAQEPEWEAVVRSMLPEHLRENREDEGPQGEDRPPGEC